MKKCLESVYTYEYNRYAHKVPAIFHDNPQRKADKTNGPPTSDTRLQLLRKQANIGNSITHTAEKH